MNSNCIYNNLLTKNIKVKFGYFCVRFLQKLWKLLEREEGKVFSEGNNRTSITFLEGFRYFFLEAPSQLISGYVAVFRIMCSALLSGKNWIEHYAMDDRSFRPQYFHWQSICYDPRKAYGLQLENIVAFYFLLELTFKNLDFGNLVRKYTLSRESAKSMNYTRVSVRIPNTIAWSYQHIRFLD